MSCFSVTVKGDGDCRYVRLMVDSDNFIVEAEVDEGPDATGSRLGWAMFALTNWAADVERDRCARAVEERLQCKHAKPCPHCECIDLNDAAEIAADTIRKRGNL